MDRSDIRRLLRDYMPVHHSICDAAKTEGASPYASHVTSFILDDMRRASRGVEPLEFDNRDTYIRDYAEAINYALVDPSAPLHQDIHNYLAWRFPHITLEREYGGDDDQRGHDSADDGSGGRDQHPDQGETSVG